MEKETQMIADRQISKEKLKAILEFAIFNESHQSDLLFSDLLNSRSYECSVSQCKRLAYAKGLCNAHYIRNKNGKDINVPIKARKRSGVCKVCNNKTNSKGGWNLCSKHFKVKRYQVIKDALIKEMGGACQRCGGVFYRSVYDFHHLGHKNDSPSDVLCNGSIEKIADELSRCILLCANCHRMEHSDEF